MSALAPSEELAPKKVLTPVGDGNDKMDPIGTRVLLVKINPERSRPEPPALRTLGLTVTIALAGIVDI
jgi:hypothetical protein